MQELPLQVFTAMLQAYCIHAASKLHPSATSAHVFVFLSFKNAHLAVYERLFLYCCHCTALVLLYLYRSDDINIVAVLKAIGAESDQEVVQLIGHDEALAALLMPSIQVRGFCFLSCFQCVGCS